MWGILPAQDLGLEELKKKIGPLFDADEGLEEGPPLDLCASYMLSNGETVNLLSRSWGQYNINELGLQNVHLVLLTNQMQVREHIAVLLMRCKFLEFSCGVSSIVQRAIHIPAHRILALKKIDVFEKEKRQQLLHEMRPYVRHLILKVWWSSMEHFTALIQVRSAQLWRMLMEGL